MDKVHVYMHLHTPLNKSTAGKKISLFPSPFHNIFSSRFTLAEAFRNGHVAACGTALRIATEANESGGYVTVPCQPM